MEPFAFFQTIDLSSFGETFSNMAKKLSIMDPEIIESTIVENDFVASFSNMTVLER